MKTLVVLCLNIHIPYKIAFSHSDDFRKKNKLRKIKLIVITELILQHFRHFTYVTTHSPTLPSLHLLHSSFSNPSIASPKSQFILQPFIRFSYVTSSSLNPPGEPPMGDWDFRISDRIKTLMDLIFNPCGEFLRSPEGPVSQIHSPHLHVGVSGIFSDLWRTFRMLKREWNAKSNEKLPHLFIPSKTATLVLEFAVEDRPLAELQHKLLSLQWKTSPWAQHPDVDNNWTKQYIS